MPMRNDMQDYVYAFRPLEAVTVNISLCDSSFDTKLILFEEGTNSSEVTLLSCNDDGCNTQSWLQVPTIWVAPFPVTPFVLFEPPVPQSASCSQEPLTCLHPRSLHLLNLVWSHQLFQASHYSAP